jgi:hypothetical protein
MITNRNVDGNQLGDERDELRHYIHSAVFEHAVALKILRLLLTGKDRGFLGSTP